MDIEAQEKQDIIKKQQKVGLLFLLAIALAVVFAYWMGALGIGPSKDFYVNYNFAGGLERGSTVRLAGIRVGRVADIEFTHDGSSATAENLRMKIEVTNAAFRQLTEDSQFYINLAGLIGERYVEIVPGSGAKISHGHQFRGIDPPRVDQLLSQGYGIFGDLRKFFEENKGDLKEMFATLNDLSKTLSKMLDGVSPQQKAQIRTLLANFAAMSEDLRSVAGSFKDFSEYMKENNSKRTYRDLQELLAKANRIEKDDLRKLMLEDGVKVNFSSKKVEVHD